jgi:hypothetical protein
MKADPKKKKAPGVAQLKKKLDAIFSQFIRLFYADENGFVKCYTCGAIHHWTKIQNGHLFSRARLATRYDLMNCRPQCCGCNVMAHGNYQVYFPKIIKEIGQSEFEQLEQRSMEAVKISTGQYQDLIMNYTRLANELKENINGN